MPTDHTQTADVLGRRAYDVAMGFRNIDPNSSRLMEFSNTHIAGMASQLSSTIKGHDVISDARSLRSISGDVLGINPYAFERVIEELDNVGLIRNVRRSGGETISFIEQVPISYDSAHFVLGESLLSKNRTEREIQLVQATHELSMGPILVEDLIDQGIEVTLDSVLKAVAETSALLQIHQLRSGEQMAASPLFAFEQPSKLLSLFESHDADDVRSTVAQIKMRPGLDIVMPQDNPVLFDMIRLGLVQAPSVTGADGRTRSFVAIPYGLSPEFLTSRKHVLEKALAIIACIRCGQVSGGATSIVYPDRIIRALMDPERDYTLAGHSSASRQYATLVQMGVIKLVPKGAWLAPKLIVSENQQDNLVAASLALTLLTQNGESSSDRGNESEAANLLLHGDTYSHSLQTLATVRRSHVGLSSAELNDAWARLREW